MVLYLKHAGWTGELTPYIKKCRDLGLKALALPYVIFLKSTKIKITLANKYILEFGDSEPSHLWPHFEDIIPKWSSDGCYYWQLCLEKLPSTSQFIFAALPSTSTLRDSEIKLLIKSQLAIVPSEPHSMPSTTSDASAVELQVLRLTRTAQRSSWHEILVPKVQRQPIAVQTLLCWSLYWFVLLQHQLRCSCQEVPTLCLGGKLPRLRAIAATPPGNPFTSRIIFVVDKQSPFFVTTISPTPPVPFSLLMVILPLGLCKRLTVIIVVADAPHPILGAELLHHFNLYSAIYHSCLIDNQTKIRSSCFFSNGEIFPG